MESKRWKPLFGYEEYYLISNLGVIKRIKATQGSRIGTIIKPSKKKIDGNGHNNRPYVWVSAKGVSKNLALNRLVCLSWHGLPPTPQHHAAHWDGNHWNNNEQNLRWATPIENEYDKKRHGR
jgi:hypothetical protein